jgi:hypothetical protein
LRSQSTAENEDSPGHYFAGVGWRSAAASLDLDEEASPRVSATGWFLSDLGGDRVKLEKTGLRLESFHDRGDPKGVFDPQAAGDVGSEV